MIGCKLRAVQDVVNALHCRGTVFQSRVGQQHDDSGKTPVSRDGSAFESLGNLVRGETEFDHHLREALWRPRLSNCVEAFESAAQCFDELIRVPVAFNSDEYQLLTAKMRTVFVVDSADVGIGRQPRFRVVVWRNCLGEWGEHGQRDEHPDHNEATVALIET